MQKVITTTLFALLMACIALPAFAAQGLQLEDKMQKREMIRETGTAVLNNIRAVEPSGTELEIWDKLWNGEPKSKAAAGLALVDRMFPEGDPSRWEEVEGFIAKGSCRPRQLAAMDGFFVAVSALREMPDGVWAAAALLDQFGKSANGRLRFIDEMPQGMREVIDDIIARTGLTGDWGSKKIHGKMPLLPIYGGVISRTVAENKRLQYLDGFGSLASNGNMAWDRDKGYVYDVVDSDGK